jgi:hypothetical protein
LLPVAKALAVVAVVAKVAVAALPVVFWFHVGTVPVRPLYATFVAVAALPEIETAYVPAARLFTVPLRVMLPLVVTVPDKLNPDAVPVPETDVTVPVVELVPAPIAVRNDAASKEETVLSALNRGNVTALGLVIVKRLLPSVVAPRFVRAAVFVVAPVPPFATATVPLTLEIGRAHV